MTDFMHSSPHLSQNVGSIGLGDATGHFSMPNFLTERKTSQTD